ncbi:hypothetical protein SH611_22195 [Geminicoccaceae bacterium 1502E]|nr:hypothetical protein [Geminicoccaceae bacterium 1502E]
MAARGAADAAGLAMRRAAEALAGRRFDEAATAAGRAALAAPAHPEPLLLLAAARLGQRRWRDAEAMARRVLQLAPGQRQARHRLALALIGQGRFEEAEALQPAVGATADQLADLGGAWLNWHRYDTAERAFRAALAQAPGHLPALTGHGYALIRLGRAPEAEEPLEAAVAAAGPASMAAAVLGCLRLEAGELRRGLDLLAGAVGREQVSPLEFSTWLCNLNYDPEATPQAVAAAHHRYGERFGRVPALAARSRRLRSGPLRVGFLSPDFCGHSVSFFFRPLQDALRARGVELFCYASVARPDAVTEEIRRAADGWRDIRTLADEEAAALIRADALDVLVDLAGHSADNRLPVLARRPAPLQLTYLGYPNGTGLPAIDARIVDAITDPPGSDSGSPDRLLRLPRCFLAWRPQAWPATAPPPCLASGRITFGSFNNAAKLNGRVVALWARLLRELPGSRLLLKSSLERHEEHRRRHLDAFAAAGVAPERVTFLGRTPDLMSHLALYGEVDIALDTFPYNGTTTSCEAMWMGVPVVSLMGQGHAGRVGASLLGAVGFPAGIARDEDDYVLTALQLARTPRLLEALRAMLRETMLASPLGDAAGLAEAFLGAVATLAAERGLALPSPRPPEERACA